MKRVASTEKQMTFRWKCERVAVSFLLPAMPDIWIQELDADSTTQECDQDSTNKGESYEEKLAKWESWLKWIGLTCPTETENLKCPSFVYILYVTEQIRTQNIRPLQSTKGHWRLANREKKKRLTRFQALPRNNMCCALVCTAILDQLEIFGLIMKRDVSKKHIIML